MRNIELQPDMLPASLTRSGERIHVIAQAGVTFSCESLCIRIPCEPIRTDSRGAGIHMITQADQKLL